MPREHTRVPLLAAYHAACDRNEDFDITADDAQAITGYRKVVRIKGD
jgi:hypothetical protein